MQNFKDGQVPVADNKAISLRNYALKALSVQYSGEELENIADWLVEHFTGINKINLMHEPHALVNQSAIIHFSNAIEQMIKGMPVQYVIGEVEFYHLKLLVSTAVLIPRPETEELVDNVIKENKDKNKLKILDIGTGSGCIALALAKHLPGCQVMAIDISKQALEIANKNAIKNQITNIEFLEMNVLSNEFFMDKKFDIIVSNPPYIALSESNTMSNHVLNYEPHQALFVEDGDPLVFYKVISTMSPQYLLPQGKIYVEINQKLGKETAALFNTHLFSSVHLLNDLYGNDRFIKAEKK